MSDFNKTHELQKKYLLPTYAPEILFIKGDGSWLWDDKGKKYLDFVSGISVCNLGHCHPSVTAAVTKQVAKLVHVSNLYMNENQPLLAEKLIKHCFPGMAFFANSGAEANEGMIKFARKHGSIKGKTNIITMEDSFHGRTLATLAATGRSKYRKGFAPDMPGFSHVPFNNIEAVKKAITDKTCAIMVEPVQGEGGIIPADKDYLLALRKLCDEKELLLLFDEVQCGMCRTGKFFAWQTYGVEPDAVSLAKALGNGFPIGAFIVKEKFKDVLGVGTHATTFGGTPLACAAATAVIDTFDKENIPEKCTASGKYLSDKLAKFTEKFSSVCQIRGAGLMIGIVLNKPANELKTITEQNGLLTLTAGENVLRLLPPLNVTKEEIDTALKIIEKALVESEKK
jgi:acetylornithine/N-succinyldiaminopimelate aminotransferase